MSNFDEYIRQGEPGRSVKAAAWQTAIGLQDVDGLKPSSYLIETVKRIMDSLKEKGFFSRRNGKRDGWWEVLIEIPGAQ